MVFWHSYQEFLLNLNPKTNLPKTFRLDLRTSAGGMCGTSPCLQSWIMALRGSGSPSAQPNGLWMGGSKKMSSRASDRRADRALIIEKNGEGEFLGDAPHPLPSHPLPPGALRQVYPPGDPLNLHFDPNQLPREGCPQA